MISTVELRKYGFVMAALFALIFGVAAPLARAVPIPQWPWAVALAFVLAAAVRPATLRPVHAAWMKLGHVLGMINSRIILTVVYFVVVFPYGLVLRAFGHDPLSLRKSSGATTYRKVSQTPASLKSSLERPY